MRILLLSWNFPPALGGMESVIAGLRQSLRNRDNEVRVVTAWDAEEDKQPDVDRAKHKGIKRYLSHCLKRGWHYCKSERPDVILCGSLVTAAPAWLLSRWFKLPFVVIIYGTDILRGGWIYHVGIRWFLKRSARLVAISRMTADLLAELGIPREHVAVIAPGVDAQQFLRMPENVSGDLMERLKDRRVLIHVGRLVRRKGVVELVNYVMPRLIQAHPDVMLVIVGDEPVASLAHTERIRSELEQAVRKEQLENHVILTGVIPLDELIYLYHHAHLFVLPCKPVPGDIEGFGIVFLEAGLAGVPSVSTDIGGIPDAVADGETGLLVSPGDFDAFTQAILRLLDDDELRRQMGGKARQRARDEFDWGKIAEQYEALFEQCAKAK